LARQKSRDRGDGSLTQRDFDDIKSELAEATAAKEDLYEQLCDTQMQLLDRTGEKERLEHQVNDAVKYSLFRMINNLDLSL
jgi:phage shock protein A